MTKDTLVTGVAQQTSHTLAARGLPRAASMIVIDTAPTVALARVTLASLKLPERLVLLWGQTILLGYVGQPTGLLEGLTTCYTA